MWSRFSVAIITLFALSSTAFSKNSEYWFYLPANLLVDEEVTRCQQLIQRASKAGYTHCLISDSKFCRLSEMPKRYFDHVESIKALARASSIELVPAVFPIGYSNDLLWQNPNLIEALPVKNLSMIVRNGTAVVADSEVILKHGDFNEGGWDWQDESVQLVDGIARVTSPASKPARIVQRVKLEPFHQYHLAVKVRTKNFQGTPEAKIIANDRVLNFDFLKVQPNQDWTVHHVVFNSLDNTEANLYLGCWDGTAGTLEWDDVSLEKIAFVNLTRRDGTPLQVMDEQGRAWREGVDFEKLVDPLLGSQPYAGVYTVYHEPPLLKAPRAKEGTKLTVSYYHGVTVHDDQANICPSEPQTLELLQDQAKRVHALWQSKSYFMSHDEIRVYNWCQACQSRNMDAGELLADNVRHCIGILRSINPDGGIYVWSDMFDPNHNAIDKYYLVRGSFQNAWLGLDKDVVVVPWYHEKRNESMRFFADRNHPQMIAAYYDAPLEQAKDWMGSAQKVPRVEGIMYTTWNRDYSQLESFIDAVRSTKK